MKNKLLIILLFAFIVPSVCNAQQNTQRIYNCNLSMNKLYKYLRSGENFELFSDNYKGEEVFSTQHDIKQNLIINCIPVLKINRFHIDTINLHNSYINDYSAFAGFIFKRNSLASIIRSTTDLSSKKLLAGKEDGEKVAILYNTYLENDRIFFYDNTFNRFCYIMNNNYYYFDTKEGKFLKVGNGKTLKKSYYEYFGK